MAPVARWRPRLRRQPTTLAALATNGSHWSNGETAISISKYSMRKTRASLRRSCTMSSRMNCYLWVGAIVSVWIYFEILVKTYAIYCSVKSKKLLQISGGDSKYLRSMFFEWFYIQRCMIRMKCLETQPSVISCEKSKSNISILIHSLVFFVIQYFPYQLNS